MLFTWDTENLCIIFRQWRVTGTVSFVFSLLGVIALTAGYEFVREMSRQHEQRHSSEVKSSSSMLRVLYLQSHTSNSSSLPLPLSPSLLLSSFSHHLSFCVSYYSTLIFIPLPFSLSFSALFSFQIETKTYRQVQTDHHHESSSLLQPERTSPNKSPPSFKLGKAAFYAVQVFYSFFIM